MWKDLQTDIAVHGPLPTSGESGAYSEIKLGEGIRKKVVNYAGENFRDIYFGLPLPRGSLL